MSWVAANILVTSAVYIVAAVLHVGYLLRFRDGWLRASRQVFAVGLALHGVAAIHVWAADGSRSPGNAALFVALISFGIALAAWIISRAPRLAVLAGFAAPLMAVVLFSAQVGMQQTRPVSPQVYAVITPLHIAASVAGVVAFFAAFIASALFLLADVELRGKRHGGIPPKVLPSLVTLEKFANRSISIGFPLYTIGIVLGGVWALRDGVAGASLQYGLAVLSWLVYGVLLHGRLRIGWRGRRAALFTIAGFMAAFSAALIYVARAVM